MENRQFSLDMQGDGKKLCEDVNATFRAMRGIFLMMKKYNISSEDMCNYIAEIAGSTKGSTIDMYVYDSIIGAIEIVYAHILKK